MKLRVITPTSVILDEEVVHVTAEDVTGSLGIRKGHLPLVTLLVPGIVMGRAGDGREHYVAVNGGVLLVNDDQVTVVSRDAVRSDDLDRLENDVIETFRRQAEEDRASNTQFHKMRLAFLRKVLEFDGAREEA